MDTLKLRILFLFIRKHFCSLKNTLKRVKSQARYEKKYLQYLCSSKVFNLTIKRAPTNQ